MKKIRIPTAVFSLVCLVMTSSCSFGLVSSIPSEKNSETDTSDTQIISTEPSQQSPSIEITTEQTAETTLPEITSSENVTNANIFPTPEVSETETASPTPVTPDYSSYTKSQVLEVYKAALTQTRNYTGALTVKQTESFNAEVKESVPDNQLVKTLANYIVDLVGSEGSQELQFSNGKAVNKDDETVPILLPQRTEFSLTADGISQASISSEGEKLHVKMVLVPETVSMGEVPEYNASAIGYLDTSDMDFNIITIKRVDIGYTGSVIDAVIRSDGYIESVTYTINMSTYAELSGMGISGSGTLEGAQTEKWELVW